MAKWPLNPTKWTINPTKVWEAWKEAASAAEVHAALVLAGDSHLVSRAAEVLSAETSSRRWDDFLASPGGWLADSDVLVVLVEPHHEDEALKALRSANRLGTGAVLVVAEEPVATAKISWQSGNVTRVSFADTDDGWQAVADAILDTADEHVVPLARRYPLLRHRAALKLISKTARQNAVIGAAFFVPGTDMPVMTVNQIKMVLGMAAIYGQELSKERAIELLGVVGAGFGFRTVARQALDFVPGPGWTFKGAMGYSGTWALGRAALKYFEGGAPATPSRLVSLAKRLRR